jgi:ATP-binding cassette, subfamily F, member 3
MQSLLQVKNGMKAFGRKLLFESAEFSIQEGEHLGVIGPNGAGKSTLFKIIVGEESFDEGEVVRSRALRLGYLSQYDDSADGESGEEYLARTSEAPIWELKTIGSSLGLSEAHFSAPIKSLSGGYRMRFRLTSVLGKEPNLLLLDEPTNYLDLESVLTLERFLCGFSGAFALISHDREFLKRVTDHTLEVEAGVIAKYPGNLEDYFEQKALMEEQLRAKEMNLALKRAEMERFVERFRAKASKAKQAQSRMKMLEKMETVEHRPVPKEARIKIPEPERMPRVPVKMRDLTLGYGGRKVLTKVDLLLENRSHVGILGMNGAGKSTLLKALAGHLDPMEGSLEFAIPRDEIGYYAQHVTEALNPNRTVFEELGYGTAIDVSPQTILDVAGSLLFAGDDVKKKVSLLSGGEKSRVALGKILLKKSPILVLDEPTNHLDFQTVGALADALRNFSGVVLVVSHDRSFIARFAESFIEIKDGKALFYKGTYDEYVWSLQHQLFDGEIQSEAKKKSSPIHSEEKAKKDVGSSSTPSSYEQNKERERKKRKLQSDSKKLEERMAELSREMSKLNEELEAVNFSDLKKVALLGAMQKELSQAEETWMLFQEELGIP